MMASKFTTLGTAALGKLVDVVASWAQIDTVLGGTEAR
jgi:hypothetical protein